MTVLHKEIYEQGEPVVMLHGWAMHTGVWREFAEALAVQRQVICLDLPGHGCSESVEPYTLERLVEVIYAELPEQPCTLVGWSLGGAVALRLAEKYPQRIKSLVLIASNPHFIKTDEWQGVPVQALNEFARNVQKNSAQTLLRFLSMQVQQVDDSKSCLKKIKLAMQECVPPGLKVLMAGLTILQTADLRAALGNLKIPAMMILGELDSLVPVLLGKQCRALQAQLQVEVIAGAGHIPFITHPQQVLILIHEFMQRGHR
ncbi:MAG: pimeloyl-ACP methyl ester esterase BioH [Methyloprofundus sp.]|nr:pimeloyl-ACP methyl ester esterase BioH [Methyloprofundus sp.]